MRRTLLLVWILGALTGGCGDDGGEEPPPGSDAGVPKGTLSFDWTLNDGSQTVACDALGATTVYIVAVPEAGGTGVVDSKDCDNNPGTLEVVAGEHTVTLELRADNPGGADWVLDTVEHLNVAVTDGQTTTMPVTAFSALPTGGLEFAVGVAGTGTVGQGNCGDESAGGAGIGYFEVELDGATDCPVVTFSVAASAAGYGGSATTVANCTSSAVCIERDQVWSADLAAGTYDLQIRGYEGSAPGELCYQRTTASFVVPGDGQVNDLGGLGLAFAGGSCAAP